MPDFDVVISGAGASGITAALAAARNGAHTLLLERYGFAGGASTAALVYPWMSFHSNQGQQVIGGIAQEIVDQLVERGGSPGHLRDTIGFAYSVTPFDPEAYKLIIDELLRSAGVEVRYHTFMTGVSVSGGLIEGLHILGKEGQGSITASLFIDSTGDGDLAAAAGVPFQAGRRVDGLMQPMTMNFVMQGIDLAEVKFYIRQHPEEFHPGSLTEELEKLPLTGVSGFFSLWKQHAPSGIPRDRMLFFAGLKPGEVMVNTTRLIGFDGTRSEDLSRAEIEGRHQVSQLVEFCRQYLPGFKDSFLSRLPTQVGVRETRHIFGQYILTAQDILAGKRFADAIACNGYPLDVHDPNGDALESDFIDRGGSYDIPYRCLLPKGIANLVVNGRCISSTHTAASSARLTPSCMAIGQAAGTAAALASRSGILPSEVPVDALQTLLRKQGALIS